MHGQEKQPGGRLADIVNIKIIRHRRRHGELQEKSRKKKRNKEKSARQLFYFLHNMLRKMSVF